MGIKPEIEAMINVLPQEQSPRRGPLRDDVVGYYGCPFVHSKGTFDCRMLFPDQDGSVLLGSRARCLIQFLSPEIVLPILVVGDSFSLWEGDTIATGIILRIFNES
jgi:hypothetical protein